MYGKAIDYSRSLPRKATSSPRGSLKMDFAKLFKKLLRNPHKWFLNMNTACHEMAKPFFVARGQGIEPRFTGPKPAVLPLDDPRIVYIKSTKVAD